MTLAVTRIPKDLKLFHTILRMYMSIAKGFLDTADGAQVAKRSESPPKPAPKESAPKESAPKESASKESASKESAPSWPASAGGFIESALGSQFASRFNLKPFENPGAKTDGPRMASSQEASEEGSSQSAPAGPDQPDVTFDSILVSAVR